MYCIYETHGLVTNPQSGEMKVMHFIFGQKTAV